MGAGDARLSRHWSPKAPAFSFVENCESDSVTKGRIVVTCCAELFESTASASARVTVTRFVAWPAPVAVTLIVTVAVWLAARLPKSHTTLAAALEHDPWLGVAEAKMKLAGSTLLTITELAVDGPELSTVSVNASGRWDMTGFGLATAPIDRSFNAVTLMGALKPEWPSASSANSMRLANGFATVMGPDHRPF